MSDNRVIYQPLHTEALDSPTYQHSANPPDDPGAYSFHSGGADEDDDDERNNASEVQELVKPSERDASDEYHRQHPFSGNHDGEVKSLAAEATTSWMIKIQAFFCAALLGVSSHFTSHMTGPLKDVLKENMDMTNTQFSLLQSSLTLFPTIIPLVGGLLVERYGTGPSSIVFTSIIILGQTIITIGCWTNSVKIMIIGFILFGLGAAPITLIQETIWVRYFRNNGMGFVLAMGLTTGKLAGFLALATSVPLSTLPPFGFVTPFIISLAVSIFAWAMNIVFLLLLKKPKEGTDAMTKITILLKTKRTNIGWKEVYGFSTMLWTMLIISFLVGASWNPFMHQASNIVKNRYNLDDKQAAWNVAVTLAVPLVVYPFLGSFIDHAGKRAWLLLITTGLLILTHVILLIPYDAIPIPPTIPMLLFALSLSIGTLSIITSIPILTSHVPTGLGLHRSIDNIGATLFGTIAGMLQDYSSPDESETEGFFDKIYHHFFPSQEDKTMQEHEDVQLLGLFLTIACLAFIVCGVFVWGDYHWTDGEGGKTRLLNSVYRKENNRRGTTRTRRNRRRRSHEVLEAMTQEPLFELADEPDAEEVSMTEIEPGHTTFHTSTHQPRAGIRHGTIGTRIPRETSLELELSEDDYESEEELHDERGEYRFRVRIDSGEDEVPQFKKNQAHFWIIFWTILLITSWTVFGVVTKQRFYASGALAAQEERVISQARGCINSKNASTKPKSPNKTKKDVVSQSSSKTSATDSKKADKAEVKALTATVTATIKPKKSRKNKEKKEEITETLNIDPGIEDKLAKGSRTKKPSKSKSKKDKDQEVLDSILLPATPAKTQLRPYQQECIDECLKNLEKGVMRQIVSLPVGSGKTVIFSHLMKQVPEPFPGANKTLILAHRQELLEQTRKHVLRNGTGLTVSVDQGKTIADMSADVIVASVPTLGRAGSTRILKYNPKEFKCIIIDEAHHAAAQTYYRILEHFGAHVPETHIFVYGCSATVRRHDGIKLGGIFDYISFHKGFVTMIEDKWLCGLRVSTVKTDIDLSDVKEKGGDFAQKDLSAKVNTPLRNEVIARSYMTYCADRNSTVVFAVDIEHLETLTSVFRSYGLDARGLSSKTNDIERANLIKDFSERKFPIIVNCGILTEGTDIPAIDSIIMARPTKSNVLFQQMLGRGMRLYPGKEDCLVLDFVDVVKGEGLVNLPTLLGLDPSSVSNKTASIQSESDLKSLQDEIIDTIEHEEPEFPFLEETVEEETIDPMTGAKIARIRVLEYDNPFQLLEDCSGMPRPLWQLSSNAWVRVAPNTYILAYQSVTLKIEKSESDGLFRCEKRTTLEKKNIKTKPTPLPIASDKLEDCIRGVDTWAASNIGYFPELVGRYARWRQGPASPSQKRFLAQMGYDCNGLNRKRNADKSLEELEEDKRRKSLTKGQASNMITRLVHGAGARWKKSKKYKLKHAKELAKDIGVDVGPIPKDIGPIHKNIV
ncbi:hypothetical protein BGZ76_003840 [Entomortierella beljakovae]|nr:hypothetical protein BGZ76_003840 [Entomortierella beljakovae]